MLTPKHFCAAFNKVLRVLCMLALVSVGFGHVFPQGNASLTLNSASSTPFKALNLQQFALPDGSTPYICSALGTANTDQDAPSPRSKDCPACRIFTSTLMPLPGPIVKVREAYSRISYLQVKSAIFRPIPVFQNASPRAPPLVFV